MLKFLVNLFYGKKYKFQIDTDKDGVNLASGEINLGETIDEISKVLKKK